MTRRTTVIQPSTTTDALYTLPNQPFKRRIVSASLYNLIIGGLYHATLPELKIADVEGNVLLAITPQVDVGSLGAITPLNYFFGNVGGATYNFTNPTSLFGPAYISATIPEDCCVPASNLLTVTLYGSLPGDTLPNLVLVTEDDDDDDDYRS